tara:strand:+ start:800 stop:2182 length:1383 start_codon:yes stop_codon:yes gene_type:complete
MAKLLKLRRGTTSQHSSFTGAEGEVTVDTTKDTVVVHDGSTQGGFPLMRESGTATVATEVTVTANNSTNETVYPIFVDGATGSQGAESDTGLTYNPSTGALTSTSFVGAVTGNVTGNASGSSGSCTGNAATATEGTNVTVTANNSTDETVYPVFVDGATGTQGIETDTGFTYNPSTGALAATTFTGNLTGNVTGNVTGNCSGTAATVTGAAQSAITSVGTLTSLTVSGDLTVQGTTTTVSSTTLTVTDKNIELGKVASPSDTTADGGGLTLKGASDKTFNWVDATDAWTSSEHIHLGDDKQVILGTNSDFKLYHANTGTKGIIANTTGAINLAGLLSEKVTITAGKLSDNQNIDLSAGNVFLFTTAETTTSTPNLRYNGSTALNDRVDTGDTISVVIINTAAAAGFSAQMTIDGNAITEKWAGAAAPSAGSAAGHDVYAYTIIKTGANAWTVLGSFSNFA